MMARLWTCLHPHHPPSFWKTLAASSLQTIGFSGLLYILRRLSPVPIPGSVSTLVYLGLHGLAIRTQPHLWNIFATAWDELVRDGPTLQGDLRVGTAAFLATQIPTVVGHLAPAVLGLLLNPIHHRPLGTGVLWAIKWLWAETIPSMVGGLIKGHRLSYAMAVAAGYFRYDWRFVALEVARLLYVVWTESRILAARLEPNMPRYEYEKITARRTIRLLRMEPRLFGMRCSLVHHDLDDLNPVTFDAISYRWGKDDKTSIVDFGGKVLPIPTSAYDVLRSRVSLWRTRLLWIDAICVNQDDKDDKNQQVRLMRDIYGKAARTIVWLGDAPDAPTVFTFMIDMLNQQNNGMTDLDVSLGHAGMKKIRDDSPKWAALTRMLENPYWLRVWIVQEIVVSRQVNILYGGHWFDWTVFSSVVCDLNSDSPTGLLQKLDLSEGMATPPFKAIHQIQAIQKLRADYQAGNKWSLPWILVSFSRSQAKYGKDHVFGFQGISTAVEDNALVPDYGREELDVFRETTLYSLAQPSSLMMLSLAGVGREKHNRPDNWPSWVPHFKLISELPAVPSLHDYAPYTAGGILPPCFYPDPHDSGKLTLPGILIDKISAVTKLPPGDWTRWRGLGDFRSADEKQAGEQILNESARMHEMQDLAESLCPPTYFNGQSRWEAFWRTCLCNKSLTSYPAAADQGDYFKAHLAVCERSGRVMRDGVEAYLTPAETDMLKQLKDVEDVANPAAPPPTAEDTLRSLEALVPLPAEIGSIRDHLTPELLNDRDALLAELFAATDLPAWAQRAIRTKFLASATLGDNDADKALEELCLRVFNFSNVETDADVTAMVRRTALFLAFNLSPAGQHVAFSPAQVQAIRQIGRSRQADPANTQRIGLLLGSTVMRRHFAVTDAGYMGLVPMDCKEGDVVGVFWGAKVVHVLRGRGEGEGYELVGEGYLHGFMDMEAWGMGKEVERITLV